VPGGGAPTAACSETGGGTPTSACSGAGTGTRHPRSSSNGSSCYRAALFATINSSVNPINARCRKGRLTSASAASGEIRKFAGDQLNKAGTAEKIERH
jgi:hypothetical protein